ncbi:MAG TPA: hypothetical protein VK517_02560 [Cyclobacteriaceae bacterium]|nr:hypothetical protein [Cyclobacteriaceae bacterium]
MTEKITSKIEYLATMKGIEGLLKKATRAGGFKELEKSETARLNRLSKLAEAYEDNSLRLMPIK